MQNKKEEEEKRIEHREIIYTTFHEIEPSGT